MSQGVGPYLVVRREDGYGDVFPLVAGQQFTLGRAPTNRIVLKDDLCSREHAEIFFAQGRWRLRDLKSLNRSRVNGIVLESEWELSPGEELTVGRSKLLFVDKLADLPDVNAAAAPSPDKSVNIKKRLGQTRYLTPQPVNESTPSPDVVAHSDRKLARDLSLLYRMALDMAMAENYEELVKIVLDGLMEGVPADVGAVLTLKEGRQLDVTAHRHRDPSIQKYNRVSEFLTNEVLSSQEAVLAEDVAQDRYLKDRESLTYIGATSLICAPIVHSHKTQGLIHLYCTDPHKALSQEDLEFTMAVAQQLGNVSHQLQKRDSLSIQNQSLKAQLRIESEMVGAGPMLRDIEDKISRIAGTNATVLVRGESGSGKELVARAIHYSSPRKDGPFICLNCAALTETLLESELFGHEKGSFTGATEKKVGKFEAANKGTIFLDEIGEMTVGTQAKLLRVLEGHPFERVGGGQSIRTDVRVVAATNQPLEKNIKEGRFRHDLFFRLQVIEIRVPPLRERREDVPLLADHFLKRFSRETGRKIRGFTLPALQKMQQYDWPGNVRELKNVIERAVALGRGPMIEAGDIWLSAVELAGSKPEAPPVVEFEPLPLEEMEKRHILQTLDFTDWNKSQAAGILQIERSTLDRKIKGYGIVRREEQ